MGHPVTILSNTRCEDLRSVAGSEFWFEIPLPYGPSDFFDEWQPPPSSIGTFYKSTIVQKCRRIVIAEGATHDGSTYTSLGALSIWMIRKTTPTTGLVRPDWKRGERDTARWLQWNPSAILKNAGRRPPTHIEDASGDCAWFEGGTVSYDLTTSTSRGRVFDAMIDPQVNGQGSTIASVTSAGGSMVYVAGADATDRHNASGFTSSPFLRLRLGTDATIYQATAWSWDGGNSRWQATVTPPLRASTTIGAAVTYLRGHPMPPGIPHDLLFDCMVYKYAKLSKVREVVPDSDPVEYRWQADSKEIVARGNAGTKIQPYLFYWRCEPRSHYAA